MLKGSKKNSQLSIPLVLWSLLKGSSVVASHWEFQIRRCLLRTAAKHVLQLCWLPVERNWTPGPSDDHEHGDGFGITIWFFFSLAKMGMLWLPWDPGVQLKVLPILSSSMGIGP
jgi:hypothetical protein